MGAARTFAGISVGLVFVIVFVFVFVFAGLVLNVEVVQSLVRIWGLPVLSQDVEFVVKVGQNWSEPIGGFAREKLFRLRSAQNSPHYKFRDLRKEPEKTLQEGKTALDC